MKRLYIILLMGIFAGFFARSETVNISPFWGFPLSLDYATIANKQITANRLNPGNIELDSLPRRQIGTIPNQTVWHEGDIAVGFYVLTDTLQSENVQLNYTIDFPPQGKIIFDETTGRFKYFPDKSDVRNFTVTFTAQSDSKLIMQDVKFILMSASPPELSAFGIEALKPAPSANDDYTIIAQTIKKNVQFNNSFKDTVVCLSISGKELIFDNRIQNKLRYLNNRSDIYELNIFAEKVIIRSALHFPQTNVTIYAKELVFEDVENQPRASINTSPVMIETLTDAIGTSGENAGNITLYIENYKQTNAALRFILIGGKGQNANRNGTPGNGGKGGTVVSTIDVSAFCDPIHGSAGLGVAIDGATIDKVAQHGENGTFELKSETFTWLHPNFISVVVKHAKDAYMNIYNGFACNIFTEYTQRINDFKTSGEWENLSDELKMELTNNENEMQAMMFRISQNLDYFGNPVGWVPMLSFEVNKLAFEQEIDKAIRVMYLSYWLKNIDGTAQQRIDACNDAIEMVKLELTDNKAALNQLILLIPELQDEAEMLEQQINELRIRVEQKRAQLEAQAQNNVAKKERNNKIAGVLDAIANVAPVLDFAYPGAGTAIKQTVGYGEKIFSMITNASDTYGYGDAFGSLVKPATDFINEDGFKKIKTSLDSINFSSLGTTFSTVKNAFITINNTAAPLINSMIDLQKVFTQNSTSNDQIKAELSRLMASSKEWQEMGEEFNVLNSKKLELDQKLATTFDNIATNGVNIEKGIVAIDGLGRDVFSGDSKRDLRAMQYVDDMERRAKERLLKYHYYMAKAYEYRMLSSYTAELNLSNIFSRFAAIAENNPAKPVLDAQDFQNLKAVYEEQLSTVTATILDEYNSNRPEMTAPRRFKFTPEDLAALNNGQDINLNIFERGMIPTDHENVRIVNFKIYDMKVHLEGNQNPYFASFDLLMEHSGLSKLRKNGEIYWFDHINRQNQNPVTWGVTYDAMNGLTDPHEPSFASSSLLYSLLDKLGQKDNIMIYSRPSAWADIHVSKNNVVSSDTKMIIDELTFELQYDFVQRPSNNRNLDIYARDIENQAIAFMPYIKISKTDKSNRADGRSTIYRTYNRGTSVNIEAPEEYGHYKFVNWINSANETVSTKNNVTVNMNNDVKLIANYKYTGPILSLVDTVKVGSNDKIVTIKVENKGLEDMEWHAISNTSWITIVSGTEGINTGNITLEIEPNTSEKERFGSITVTASETAEYSKEVKIVQSVNDVAVSNISLNKSDVYPNPFKDILTIKNAENMKVIIYSILGDVIYEKDMMNKEEIISTASWNRGIYLLKIMYNEPNVEKYNYVKSLIKY